MSWPFGVVFALAFAVALVLTPVAAWLGRKWGVVDRPGGRRKHQGAVPRLGGIALFGGFLVATLASVFLRDRLPPTPEGPDPQEMTRWTAVLLGSAFVFVFGLLDDLKELSPGPQYLAQAVAAGIAMSGVVFIERVMNPFTDQLVVFPWPVVVGLTLFWIMGMMNTVNFLDGLDGLAAGITAIVATVLVIHMVRVGQYGPALLPVALLGATLGFLPYNMHPARVFMGSCGSFFLGYAVATLSLVGGARVATVLLVMSVPVADVAWQIVRRRRMGRSIGEGDRGHLHFRLYDLGLSQRQVVGIYWGVSALFGVMALLLSSRLYKLVAIVGMGLIAVLILALLSREEGRLSSGE